MKHTKKATTHRKAKTTKKTPVVHRKKAAAPKKGVAGKGTGASTRKAITDAQEKGSTLKQIAAAGMRDESTIGAIAAGEIKNPPSNLAGKIKKAKVTKKKAARKR